MALVLNKSAKATSFKSSRKPLYFAAITFLLYLAFTVFMVWRSPDLEPKLQNWPNQFFLFVHPGSKWDVNNSRPVFTDDIGYDGQFYYDLGRSPLNPLTRLDKPAYRSARIFYPVLTFIFSVGQADLVPVVMIVINLIAISFTVYGLGRVLALSKQSSLWALGYAIWPGTLCSFFYDLAEPVCFAFIVAAIWLYLERPKATGWFALLILLASLTKELGLLWGIGWLLYYLVRREWQTAAKLIAIWLVPFGLWQGYLQLKFGVNGLSAGEPFAWFPLAGFLRAGSYHPPLVERVAVFTTTIIPLMWSIFNWWKHRPSFQRLKDWLSQQEPFFYTWLTHGLFLLFLPTATFIYLVDHARNFIGLFLVLYLWPVVRSNGLRKYLLTVSLFWTMALTYIIATTGNAYIFLYFLGFL